MWILTSWLIFKSTYTCLTSLIQLKIEITWLISVGLKINRQIL